MIINTIFFILGAAVTIFVAKKYYEKASEDLLAEAKDLKTSTWIIIRALEENGMLEAAWEDGKPKGIKITRRFDTKVEITNLADKQNET